MVMVRIALAFFTACLAWVAPFNAAFAQCANSTSMDASCYGSKFKATKNSLLGWRLLHEKKYKEAIEAYNRAIQESPNDASNYNNRADAFERLGDRDCPPSAPVRQN